jgi:tRNA A-37 threonylcarbamoyl transferase component Bud32
MSDRLTLALDELSEVWPEHEEVVRADVASDGGLVLTASGAGVVRWFSHDDRGLIERFPESDRKVPLSGFIAESSDWQVLSYRPGRRMVVLVRRDELVNVIKGYKKSRSAHAAVHQRIAEAAMGRGAFKVPRLLRHDADHEALVFERLEGSEVELGLESVPLYARLGERLAVFQEDEISSDITVFSLPDEFGVLERWREKIETAVGVLPAGWSEVHARLLAVSKSLPPARMGLAHRDLHDRQVHLVQGEVTMLDFDLLCCADVALDPGNLVAHLRWRALLGLHGASQESCRALESAFLESLGRSHEEGFEKRLAFYTASTFLRLALVYRLRPRWSGRVTELVSQAQAILDDLATVR